MSLLVPEKNFNFVILCGKGIFSTKSILLTGFLLKMHYQCFCGFVLSRIFADRLGVQRIRFRQVYHFGMQSTESRRAFGFFFGVQQGPIRFNIHRVLPNKG